MNILREMAGCRAYVTGYVSIAAIRDMVDGDRRMKMRNGWQRHERRLFCCFIRRHDYYTKTAYGATVTLRATEYYIFIILFITRQKAKEEKTERC